MIGEEGGRRAWGECPLSKQSEQGRVWGWLKGGLIGGVLGECWGHVSRASKLSEEMGIEIRGQKLMLALHKNLKELVECYTMN